jgi:ferrous iron transport protein B
MSEVESPSSNTLTGKRRLTVALVGNPNTGKTSIFNNMTGLRQRVANYPGITVEKKTGTFELPNVEVEVVDLPGTYSLCANSVDERVVVDVLSGHVQGVKKPDMVVCVLDATNLKRNLFLASQIAELDIPMVLALNLSDEAKRKGIRIDAKLLSQRMCIPVVETVARKNQGTSELMEAIYKASINRHLMKRIKWPETILEATNEVGEFLNEKGLTDVELRRILFDSNSSVLERVGHAPNFNENILPTIRKKIWKAGINPLAAEALMQYGHLGSLLEGVVTNEQDVSASTSESIDKLMIHRFWGLAIFIGMMYLVFQAVYAGAAPLMDLVDGGKSWIQGMSEGWFVGMPRLQSLVTDGIIEGVGAFVIFLPQIMVLFFFIALLEESGYMSRAAFLMDKFFHWCGLNGKSFVPMLSSYACAVPGIMATRTIEDPKARLTTILVAPLMSCSARLPVYVLLIGALVEPSYGAQTAGLALFGMHLVGIFIAVPAAYLFNKFVVRTTPHPFIMELPPYRVPQLRNVLWRMLESAREFVIRAGTVIFALTIVIWAMLYFPRPESLEAETRAGFVNETASAGQLTPDQIEEALKDPDSTYSSHLEKAIESAYEEQSYMGRLGKAAQPAFDAAGFDWKITVGLLASFPAREVIISTLGIIYKLGGDVDEESPELRSAIRNAKWQSGPRIGQPVFTIPVVFAIMVFFALCSQCASTLAVISKETNWRWAVFAFAYMTVFAWAGAVVVYQIGTALSG